MEKTQVVRPKKYLVLIQHGKHRYILGDTKDFSEACESAQWQINDRMSRYRGRGAKPRVVVVEEIFEPKAEEQK